VIYFPLKNSWLKKLQTVLLDHLKISSQNIKYGNKRAHPKENTLKKINF